jgi:predicted DNA-binding transcriptional regulator AlpA
MRLQSSHLNWSAALRHRDLHPPSLFGDGTGAHGGTTMTAIPATLPPRYLRTPEAARFLSLSGRTLEKHRTFGTGPAYRKLGGRVVYALDDLQAWADRGAKQSTSDPGVGTVYPAKRLTATPPPVGRR